MSRKSTKKFQRLERLNGELIHCNPPQGVPKWAVDTDTIQSDGASSDGQPIELDPLAEPTEQSDAVVSAVPVAAVPVVESESDSDFTLDLS